MGRLNAQDYQWWYDRARANPEFIPALRSVVAEMSVGLTYTITTFKNLRHRIITGSFERADDEQVVLDQGKAAITDIVRITMPSSQLDF